MQKANNQRLVIWHRICFLLPFFVFVTVIASSALKVGAASAAGVSFGFSNSGEIADGMAVSVSKKDPDRIEQAHVENQDYLFGVTVEKSESTIIVDKSSDGYFVATDGEVAMFVSDIEGDIRAGDLLSISKIGGVGVKANESLNQKIIGIAKKDFTGDEEGVRQVNLANNGRVNVGSINVELLIRESTSQNNENNESILEYIARRIVGKPVSLAQAIVALALVVIGFLVGASFLYASIRSSFVSIGRNPLSTDMIYKGLVKSSIITIAIILITLIAGYIVLII